MGFNNNMQTKQKNISSEAHSIFMWQKQNKSNSAYYILVAKAPLTKLLSYRLENMDKNVRYEIFTFS